VTKAWKVGNTQQLFCPTNNIYCYIIIIYRRTLSIVLYNHHRSVSLKRASYWMLKPTRAAVTAFAVHVMRAALRHSFPCRYSWFTWHIAWYLITTIYYYRFKKLTILGICTVIITFAVWLLLFISVVSCRFQLATTRDTHRNIILCLVHRLYASHYYLGV